MLSIEARNASMDRPLDAWNWRSSASSSEGGGKHFLGAGRLRPVTFDEGMSFFQCALGARSSVPGSWVSANDDLLAWVYEFVL